MQGTRKGGLRGVSELWAVEAWDNATIPGTTLFAAQKPLLNLE